VDGLARLILLLLAVAAFVQITRGTFRQWLHVKLTGRT
jgi:hypothetical protein